MKLRKGILVTSTFETGHNGELMRGKVTEDCPDADLFMVRVKWDDEKRSRWENRENLIVKKEQSK